MTTESDWHHQVQPSLPAFLVKLEKVTLAQEPLGMHRQLEERARSWLKASPQTKLKNLV